jgi:putative transposase
MARPLRIEFAGAVYHVTIRGNAKQAIFLDRPDWDGFLDILSSVIAKFGWVCHAYCLMENHLVMETPRENLSRICQGENFLLKDKERRKRDSWQTVFDTTFQPTINIFNWLRWGRSAWHFPELERF